MDILIVLINNLILFTEFRDRIEKEYPVGVQLYHSISNIYLNFMPERLRDKVLNVENETTQSPTSDNKSADKWILFRQKTQMT